MEYHSENEASYLKLKIVIGDLDARLRRIDQFKAKADASSEKSLQVLKKMLLDAGKRVVVEMEEAQKADKVDDMMLEIMVEDLARRLLEMEKSYPN